MLKKLINSLQIDLLKKHIGPFLFCFLTLMFLLLMQFLILHIDSLIGKDIPISVIFELILTNLAYMVVLAAPMAVLVATLMAFGKFSELHELTAIRASGVHPMKVIFPVLISSIILFFGLAWFSNDLLPEANHKSRSLFIDIRLKKPGFDLKPNEFYDGIEGYIFLVDQIDSKTDSLFGITLFQEPTRNNDRAFIKAKKGYLKSENSEMLTLYLFDGNMQKFPTTTDRNKTTIEISEFNEHRITFDLADLAFEKSDPNRRNRSDRTMNIQSMQVIVDSLKQDVVKQYDGATQLSTTIPNLDTGNDGRQRLFDHSTDQKDTTLVTSSIAVNDQLSIINQKRIFQSAVSDLNNYKASLQNIQANVIFRQKSINRYLVEIHKKFSIPFACIVFILLGAPIGIMSKRGNFGIAAMISTVILTFYWISLIQGEKLADRLFVSPFIGMWSFNIVFSIIGIILLVRLVTEFRISDLFSKDEQ
jgi:lipopolysaccharide export system permease protein